MNKFALNSIEESVKKALLSTEFSKPKIILGVSGGPDSMALLYILKKIDADVFVVHINYGLRGKESDLDQELVEGMCSLWNFECCSVNLNPKEESGNFQNWARKERYRIFQELKEELNAQLIATAHHQGDQLETIFQKLMRGSNPETWQGMKVWDEVFFRPLLPFTKNQILKYCEENAVPFRVDESNLESKYARNFFRNELVIELDHFYPGWKNNMLSLKQTAKVTTQAVEEIVRISVSNEGLNIEKIEQLQSELRKAVLKKFIEGKVSDWIPTKGQLEEFERLVFLQTGKRVPINEHISLVKDRKELMIERTSELEQLLIKEEELEEGKSILYNSIIIEASSSKKEEGLYIDLKKVTWPLCLRKWKNGDVFVPFGMNQSQKISDHLTNRKISASKKEKALVLCGSDSTIYAIFFLELDQRNQIGSISEKVKCTEITQMFLTAKNTTNQ